MIAPATTQRAHVAYLATSRSDIRDQALYAAYSALAWQGDADVRVHLFTDDAGAFAPIAAHVELEPLPAARAKEWVRPWGLVFRLKPKAFEDLFARFPGERVLLLDSDTFFTGPVHTALERIGERAAVMHVREYEPLHRGTLEMRNFCRRMRRARFRGASISLEPWMWNAGVVGLHPTHTSLVRDWLDFIDDTYPSNPKGSVEQYGISWLVQRSGLELSAVDDVVCHYYPDKERYLAAIRAELEVLRTLPLDVALERVRSAPVRTSGPIPKRPRLAAHRRIWRGLRTRLGILAVRLCGRCRRIPA